MHRRGLLILTITSLIGRSVGLGRKSVAVQHRDDASVHAERERLLALKRIDDFKRELAARNRQLEFAHRSLTAQLKLARVMLAKGISS